MLLLEIELDQIRPLREYWGPLGNHQWQLFNLIWRWAGGLEVPSQYDKVSAYTAS